MLDEDLGPENYELVFIMRLVVVFVESFFLLDGENALWACFVAEVEVYVHETINKTMTNPLP